MTVRPHLARYAGRAPSVGLISAGTAAIFLLAAKVAAGWAVVAGLAASAGAGEYATGLLRAFPGTAPGGNRRQERSDKDHGDEQRCCTTTAPVVTPPADAAAADSHPGGNPHMYYILQVLFSDLHALGLLFLMHRAGPRHIQCKHRFSPHGTKSAVCSM